MILPEYIKDGITEMMKFIFDDSNVRSLSLSEYNVAWYKHGQKHIRTVTNLEALIDDIPRGLGMKHIIITTEDPITDLFSQVWNHYQLYKELPEKSKEGALF